MHDDVPEQQRTAADDRVYTPLSLLAGIFISAVVTAVEIGTWVNHWHIAECFYAASVQQGDPHSMDSDIIGLLRSGNSALPAGFVWLAITLAGVGVAVVLRRRRAR